MAPEQGRDNFLQMVEEVAQKHGWPCEESDEEDECNLYITDETGTDYMFNFMWTEPFLHIGCTVEISDMRAREAELRVLMSRVNEMIWVGHMDIFAENGVIMFRYALYNVGVELEALHVEVAIAEAMRVLRTFLPVIILVNAGQPPSIDLSLVTAEIGALGRA